MAWAVVLGACVLAVLTQALPLDNSPSPRGFVGFSFWPPAPEVAPVECAAANTLLPRGTCFRAADCEQHGGVASGKCASGGVCCVVPVLCGGVVKHNNTWFVNKDFPKATTDPATCTITIKRANAKMVQARLELEVLDLGTPRRGRCREDSFLASRRRVSQPLTPVLCGNNSRQHLYVDLLPGEVEVKVKLDNSHLLARQDVPQRQWKVLITQHSQEDAAPHGCLQYYRHHTSTVHSLNYDSGLNFAGQLNYDVCFTRLSRSLKSEDSCKRQFNNVNMEQNSLSRMMRDDQPAGTSKRRKTNRHGSSDNSKGRRNGVGRGNGRAGRGVEGPRTHGSRRESDHKQYTHEDRVNFGVLDVVGLVNRTVEEMRVSGGGVEEMRVSGGAVAEEGDHNIIPLIVWSQENGDRVSSDPNASETIMPDLTPVNPTVESSSPTILVSYETQDQSTIHSRPIPVRPLLESHTNEAVITQIQQVVHQMQQEKEQQHLNKDKEEGEGEEEEEEHPGLGTTMVVQDQTEATTDLVTQVSTTGDVDDPHLANSDIPVTEPPTSSPEPSPITVETFDAPHSESSPSPLLQDSVEITSGYISVQQDAESDFTTSYPKFTMKIVLPVLANTQMTTQDDRISSVHTASLNTHTTTLQSTPDLTTTSSDTLTTTLDDHTFSSHTLPFNTPTTPPDTTTTAPDTETITPEDTTTHSPITPTYVPLSNTESTTHDDVTSSLQTTPANDRIASPNGPATPPITASDLYGVPALTEMDLGPVKEIYPPGDVTNIETNVEEVDEMLEKLKDQFLTEYLLNGNLPSEDVGNLFLESYGGTKSEEDTSWVTAGMVVSGGATIPSSLQGQDLMGVSEHPLESTVTPEITTLEEDVISILESANFTEYLVKTDSTTDANPVRETDPVTFPEALTMEESTEPGPTINLEFVTEPTVGFALTIADYSITNTTTNVTTTSVVAGLDVYFTKDVEAPPEDIHSELGTPNEQENNTQATIDLIVNTITSTPTTTTTTTIHLTPSASTTIALITSTPVTTTTTLTTTSTLITIIPTIINIISASPPIMTIGSTYPKTTTTTTSTSSTPQTTVTYTPVTTTTIAFDITSVTTTIATSGVTTFITASPSTAMFVSPTTTITIGLSTIYPPGTGDSMQVELTVTDPESVQVVGDLVMADPASQNPTNVQHLTSQPTLGDGITWLILNGSEASVSLPQDTVVSSGIGFPSESDQLTVVSPETHVTVMQDKDSLAHMAGEAEITTESLGTLAAEEEGYETFGVTPLYKPHVGVTESNELTDQDDDISVLTSTTSSGDITVTETVETSSSAAVTVTEAVVRGTATSQKVVGTTSFPAADGALPHTITEYPENTSTESLTIIPGLPTTTITSAATTHSPTTTTTSAPATTYSSPTTTTTTTSASTIPTTTPSASTTPTTTTPTTATFAATTSTTTPTTSTTPTTIIASITTSPAMTVIKDNLDVHINVNVGSASSEVELSDSNENVIEATIDLITNSDDLTLVEDGHTEDDVEEIMNEGVEDTQPSNDELVCGGAYVMVRQRMVCGGQQRHNLPDLEDTPDDRFEDVERFSVRTVNGATRSLRFSLDYKTKCPRAAPPPASPPAPTKKRVTLLQYMLGWYR